MKESKTSLILTLFVVLLASAACTSTSDLTVNDDTIIRNMENGSNFTLDERTYYPENELDEEPELVGDRDYRTSMLGAERGTGQQVVKRKPSETSRYGIMVAENGKITGFVPLNVSDKNLEEIRKSYRYARYSVTRRNGEPVSYYVIIEEQF